MPVVWIAGPWTSCYQPGPKPPGKRMVTCYWARPADSAQPPFLLDLLDLFAVFTSMEEAVNSASAKLGAIQQKRLF